MDIHKGAAWAQVLSFPTGAYCAYGTYVTLHPAKFAGTVPMIFDSTALAISFGVFATCLLIGAIAHFSPRRENTPNRGYHKPEILSGDAKQQEALPPKQLVRLTIIEGVLAERPRADDTTVIPIVEVRLRIRVFATEPDAKLDSWRLELRFGNESYCAMDLAYDKFRFRRIQDPVPAIQMPPMPSPVTDTEPSIREIAQREALPVNSDVQGWIGFRTTDPQIRLDDVLGCDFHLSAFAKGKLCEVTMRPGPWRKRVNIS